MFFSSIYLDSCLCVSKIIRDAGQFIIDNFVHKAIIIANEKGMGLISVYSIRIYLYLKRRD